MSDRHHSPRPRAPSAASPTAARITSSPLESLDPLQIHTCDDLVRAMAQDRLQRPRARRGGRRAHGDGAGSRLPHRRHVLRRDDGRQDGHGHRPHDRGRDDPRHRQHRRAHGARAQRGRRAHPLQGQPRRVGRGALREGLQPRLRHARDGEEPQHHRRVRAGAARHARHQRALVERAHLPPRSARRSPRWATRRASSAAPTCTTCPVFVPAFTDSEMGLDVATWMLRKTHAEHGNAPDFDVWKHAVAARLQPLPRPAQLRAPRRAPRRSSASSPSAAASPATGRSRWRPSTTSSSTASACEMEHPRFSYGVRICPEPVHWGGLSGCTYSEGVSWGKFVPAERGRQVRRGLRRRHRGVAAPRARRPGAPGQGLTRPTRAPRGPCGALHYG